jgi:hypothetical protein
VISNIQSKFYPLAEHTDLLSRRQWWALLGVVLLHISVLMLFRFYIKSEMLKLSLENAVLPMEVEIVPKYYAEVNPEVAENQPDKSQFYSFQDQQAADTSLKESNSPVPLVKGSEASSSKIVSAEVITEEAQLSPGLYQVTRNQKPSINSEASQAQPMPLTHSDAGSISQINPFEKAENELGVDVITFKNQKESMSDRSEQRVIIPITKDALTLNPQASAEDASVMKKNRPAPMARPKLSSEITSGPIMQSTASANKFGAIALDASFSEFGEYEQQFYSALQVGWYNEVAFYKPLDTGTQVSISFILKSDGSIDSVTVLSSTAGLIATSICESAITKRSPFRPWTQDMIQVFGDQKELKVRFYYR